LIKAGFKPVTVVLLLDVATKLHDSDFVYAIGNSIPEVDMNFPDSIGSGHTDVFGK
jgi:hypothetical protein